MRRAILPILLTLLSSPVLRADIPNLPPAVRLARATDVVTGNVRRVYTHEELTGAGCRKRWFVLEVSVDGVEKGAAAAGNRLLLASWRIVSVPRGWAGSSGQRFVPAAGQRVRVFAAQRDGRLDLLLPNGLERLEPAAPKARGPLHQLFASSRAAYAKSDWGAFFDLHTHRAGKRLAVGAYRSLRAVAAVKADALVVDAGGRPQAKRPLTRVTGQPLRTLYIALMGQLASNPATRPSTGNVHELVAVTMKEPTAVGKARCKTPGGAVRVRTVYFRRSGQRWLID